MRKFCRFVSLLAFASVGWSCAHESPDPTTGQLVLALDDASGNGRYRLTHAQLTLDGPEQHAITIADQPSLSLDLASGLYTLTVADDYQVVDTMAPGGAHVPAKLVGENPTTVLVAPGEATAVTLRFELDLRASAPVPRGGTLNVGVDIATMPGPDTCAESLRISELDYDQAGADSLEFVEVTATRDCIASLAHVVLELVNGGDGSVYGRYALDAATSELPRGKRLVVGDAVVLSALPASTPSIALTSVGLQNGPDALRLKRGDTVLDRVAYNGAVAGEGEGEPAPADTLETSLGRCPDGPDGAADSDHNASDFRTLPATPGAPNACLP